MLDIIAVTGDGAIWAIDCIFPFGNTGRKVGAPTCDDVMIWA